MADNGYALFDWCTRQRLEIHRDVIVENIQLALNAMVKLEANVAHLIGQLKLDEELDKLFSTLPEISEPDEGGTESAKA
jgi:hypothetical protein